MRNPTNFIILAYIIALNDLIFYVLVRITAICLAYRLNKAHYENLSKAGSYCHDDVKIKLFNAYIYSLFIECITFLNKLQITEEVDE